MAGFHAPIDWVLIYCIALGLAGGIPVGAILQARWRSKDINKLMDEAISNAEKATTQPTAAEVIAAAEKALERLLPWALQAGANAEDALALCARWKEANGDGANTR